MPANALCRKAYSKDICARSLDILNRTILVPTHPLHTAAETETIIHNIHAATRVALGGLKRDEVDVRKGGELDVIKYDLKETA